MSQLLLIMKKYQLPQVKKLKYFLKSFLDAESISNINNSNSFGSFFHYNLTILLL